MRRFQSTQSVFDALAPERIPGPQADASEPIESLRQAVLYLAQVMTSKLDGMHEEIERLGEKQREFSAREREASRQIATLQALIGKGSSNDV